MPSTDSMKMPGPNAGGGLEGMDVAMGSADATPERIEAERSALVAQRQAKLEQILDTHDTLVRESFHMEKFVSMLYYDPEAAKTETSAVLDQYRQAKYDLLNNATSSAGPSRSTRRSQTERLSHLKGATPSVSAPTSVRNGSAKKPRDAGGASPIVSDAKVKRKGKEPDRSGESVSAPQSRHKGKGKAPPAVSRITAHEPLSTPQVAPPDHSISSRPLHTRSTRPPENHYSDDIPFSSISAQTGMSTPSPRKKRKTDTGLPQDSSHRHHRRRSEKANGIQENEGQSQPQTFAGTPFSSIKRLKLIVRPPPPSFSNPRQRPPPSRHGNSLPALLSSYRTLNDQDVDQDQLAERAKHDATIYDRMDALRAEGRLFPIDDDMYTSFVAKSHAKLTSDAGDVWAHVVEAAAARGRARRVGGRGSQVAGQVANRIQAYWEGHAARMEKGRAQEERRLRTLAKATMKMVTNEWKKVVFHLREEERKRAEEEEKKRGHEHLDAILNQSGQILETQQSDLARGEGSIPASRSRSSSASDTFRDWASMLDDPDDPSSSEHEEVSDDEGSFSREGSQHLGSDEEDGTAELGVGSDEEDDLGSRALLPAPSSFSSDHCTPSTLDDEDASMHGDDIGEFSRLPSSRGLRSPAQESRSSPPPGVEVKGLVIDPMSATSLVSASDKSVELSLPSNQELTSPSHALFNNIHESPILYGYTEPIDPASASTPLLTAASPDFVDATPELDLVHSTNGAIFDRYRSDSLRDPRPVSDIDQPADTPLSDVHDTGVVSDTVLATSPLPIPEKIITSTLPDAPPAANEDLPPHSVGGSQGTRSPSQDLEYDADEENKEIADVPEYLKPYAVAPVTWNPENKVKAPFLLRGVLRPYQQSGLEWLASLHARKVNGILADEMGLGKTIQTISLLAHLACDWGIWGPHLIVVPTSVLLNWEMEFKKFLPGFKVLSYHGTTKRRKELRHGWNDKHHFNVCITSYTLASRDAHIFKRKAWYYMILDEAHMIKNFKSQRWNILLMFRSFRRLLLTGTPLQNNLTELWALLQFLMSGTSFANVKEFNEWFSNPLERAIEMGTVLDDENTERVSKLHAVLRPYLLRRLKRDVEKELPRKYDHLVLCPLSKRQRFLYDEFMTRAHTRDALQSGVYQKIANILMQLRKVCNHPDLFEVRPVVTSFAMERSAIADFEIKDLLVRRRLLQTDDDDTLNLDVLGFRFIHHADSSLLTAVETRRLDGTSRLPFIAELPGEPPPKDRRTIAGFRTYTEHMRRAETIAQCRHTAYLNRLRCSRLPAISQETIRLAQRAHRPLTPLSALDLRVGYMETCTLIASAIKSYEARGQDMASSIEKFAFVTPAVVARDMPGIALAGFEEPVRHTLDNPAFDTVLHRPSVKLQIAFPDPSLLQYDCGKLQELTRLLREKKAGGHRVLIFTQMTKILDILEMFLNFHGYLYLRLDGATKIEDRQYVTERFNADARVFCFIASSRSGGVGINLTGADTVVFYDSDFNPQMDRQCEDRAHRIGQIRDVHVYRFVSQHTVEEAMLRKANQKRSLDDLVIQKGEFDWRSLFGDDGSLAHALGDQSALTNALGEFEEAEDAHAAAVAAREEVVLEGADEADFGESSAVGATEPLGGDAAGSVITERAQDYPDADAEEQEEEDGGAVLDYMLAFARKDHEFFREWRL
ncbi:hypothetical protein PLICRDRAFT_170194 [Plicaturopsis crispa FD-325 SS-3]|nr:hypothetical protein PLICRDRAFT_170194 [Plicaturopsis crispa FD-325 SS-3]